MASMAGKGNGWIACFLKLEVKDASVSSVEGSRSFLRSNMQTRFLSAAPGVCMRGELPVPAQPLVGTELSSLNKLIPNPDGCQVHL